MEGFYETIVKHIKTPKERLLDLGFLALGVVGAFAILFVTNLMQLHVIGVFGAGAAIFFGIRAAAFNRWEYEYIVTEGVVDIDQIIAQRKRKRILSFDSRDCEIIAPMHHGTYYADYKDLPTVDLTAYAACEDNYFAVLTRAGVRTAILFQPSEDMVQMFKHYNPKNVFIA